MIYKSKIQSAQWKNRVRAGAARERVTWLPHSPTITWFIDCHLWFTCTLLRSPMHSNWMPLLADEWPFMSRVSPRRSWEPSRRFARSSCSTRSRCVAQPWRLCFVCLTFLWRVLLRVLVWVYMCACVCSISLSFRKRLINVSRKKSRKLDGRCFLREARSNLEGMERKFARANLHSFIYVGYLLRVFSHSLESFDRF